EGVPMRFSWPADTVFTRQVLCVEQDHCERCQGPLHVCDHRFHRLFSLTGPLELVCKLAHCPDPGCPAHHHHPSPPARAPITPPGGAPRRALLGRPGPPPLPPPLVGPPTPGRAARRLPDSPVRRRPRRLPEALPLHGRRTPPGP